MRTPALNRVQYPTTCVMIAQATLQAAETRASQSTIPARLRRLIQAAVLTGHHLTSRGRKRPPSQ